MDAHKSAKGLAFAAFLHSVWEFGARKHFTDHHIAHTIHGFWDSVLACKIHDCYCRIRKNFEQHVIPSHSSDTSDHNGWTTLFFL